MQILRKFLITVMYIIADNIFTKEMNTSKVAIRCEEHAFTQKYVFQGKGKYMKVKEFLENFTGDNHIKIYDMHNFDTHRFNNANEAIRQFGYYTVREWKIIDNVLKITIRTQY